MRSSAWPLVALVVLGCKGEPFRPDAKLDADIDAYQPPWWTPTPGSTPDWDIQLAEPIDVSAARAMYVVDLWQVTPAKMITYTQGAPVSVPAGPRAGLVDTLHARTPKPIVICHLNVASVNLTTDPDRMKFPGYEANPPDDPTPPKAGSVVGWRTGGPAGERWLDISAAGHALWKEVLEKRIQLAKEIGCDGLDTANGVPYPPSYGGFGPHAPAVFVSFLTSIATAAHDRELSAGTRAAYEVLPSELAVPFDWMLMERCAEPTGDPFCQLARPFLNAKKAVFAVDYDVNGTTIELACMEWRKSMIDDGVFKHDPPAGNYRMVCP